MERAFLRFHGFDDNPSPGNAHLDGGIQVDAHFLQQVCRNGHQDALYDFIVRFLHGTGEKGSFILLKTIRVLGG